MKVMCKKVSLGSFPVYDRHGEMTVGEEVVAGSKTTVVAWKNLKGQRGACQWIGFQSNDFNQKTLKFNAWINFVGALPTDSELRRGNFGLKVCGKFYNSFMTNAVADTWIHINEEVQCNGGDGRHIIMIFDNLQTQDQVIKMHSVSLKDPSLDGKKFFDKVFSSVYRKHLSKLTCRIPFEFFYKVCCFHMCSMLYTFTFLLEY